MATKKKKEEETAMVVVETAEVVEAAGEGAESTGEELVVAAVGLQPLPMGYDGFTEDDLIIPRYFIVQKSSEAVDKGYTVGHFVSNISDESVESMRCTAILYRKGMVHFIKPYQKGQKPDCRSNDALHPSPSVEKPYSAQCHKIVRRRMSPVCPEACWVKDPKTGKNSPPSCNLCFNVVMRREDTGSPFFMSFRSSALRSIRAFISNLWSIRKNLFAVSFLLSTERVENQYGTFYVPRISDIESHESAVEPSLVEVYKGMQAMNLDDSFEDERNQEDVGGEATEDTSFNTSDLENEKF